MMMHAYPETYLSDAQAVLGDAFDYAVNTCHIAGPEFVKLFLASSYSTRMENGEPSLLAGKSGIELASDIVFETTGVTLDANQQKTFERSPEYWIGWAVCYYQWVSGRNYHDIFCALPYDDLKAMYCPLHEADITKMAEIADERLRAYFSETNLKRFRTLYGLSLAELSKRSGVSLHSIQMYEQRNKDINKASAAALYRISRVLGCTMEDLLEK